MRLTDLFAGNFETYFEDAHSGKPLWVFIHVPKTAGSSLNGELMPILFPNHHIFIDYSKLSATEASQSYETLFNLSVDRFIGMAKAKRYRYVTGHINTAQMDHIAAGLPEMQLRPITLLREPVSRFISDYRYQRSTMHPGHVAFSEQYPNIRDYLRQPGDWNKTATSLLPPELYRAGDAEACVDWLIDTYKFIGIQEMYSLSLHALSWFGGVPKRPKVRRRINTPTAENEVVLTYDLQEEIRARNSLDVAIYDAIAPRFVAISDGLTKYLDRVAPRPPRE